MKTTDYKKGDVVILSDVGRDARFEYLGEAGCTRHAYRPLDGKTEFATMKTDAVGEFAPFPNKVAVKAVKRKWYQKIANWWKASGIRTGRFKTALDRAEKAQYNMRVKIDKAIDNGL